jgi:hypothetical protein
MIYVGRTICLDRNHNRASGPRPPGCMPDEGWHPRSPHFSIFLLLSRGDGALMRFASSSCIYALRFVDTCVTVHSEYSTAVIVVLVFHPNHNYNYYIRIRIGKK